jgi:aryl-alcohol dehydrogenase-like predicted oxidoreductase
MDYSDSISKMTLGTVQLGLNYGIANKEGKPDEEKAFMILDSALDSGVSCLDTAADYGDSEKIIGRYFSVRKKIRSDISIVTKFKLGSVSGSDVESAVMKSVEKSLANLKTDYIDILLMHDAREFSTFGKSVSKVLEKLLTDGTIKMAGASCYKFGEIEPMLGNEIFNAFQIPVNLLDIRITRGESSKRLKEKLVFARSVFLQGLFFLDPSELKGNLREIDRYLVKINEIAREMNITVSQLSVAYVNSLDYVNSLVIGADNPDQVLENSKLLDFRLLNREILNTIEERLSGAPDWLFMPVLWDKQ